MRRLWTEPVIDLRGPLRQVTAAGINPLPVQRPIPIWIGGSAERAPAPHRAAGRRLLPAAPARGRLAGDDGADAGVAGGGRARLGRVRHRAADQRRRGNARRLAADGGGVARARRHAHVARDDGRRLRGCRAATSSGCEKRRRRSRDRARAASSATRRSTRRRRSSSSPSSRPRRRRRSPIRR